MSGVCDVEEPVLVEESVRGVGEGAADARDAAMVLVRVLLRWIVSRRNSREIFFLAMAYLAASLGPTWRIFVAWSSITWEAPSGAPSTSPSRTTQVPVALSSSMPCTSDRTTHCRLTGPVPSLSSRKHEGALVRDAAGLDPAAHHDIRADQRGAAAGAVVYGADAHAVVQLAAEVLDGRGERGGTVGSGACSLAATAASTAASCALSSLMSMSTRAAMLSGGIRACASGAARDGQWRVGAAVRRIKRRSDRGSYRRSRGANDFPRDRGFPKPNPGFLVYFPHIDSIP